MRPEIIKITKESDCENLAVIAGEPKQLDRDYYSIDEFTFIEKQFSKNKKDFIAINRFNHSTFIVFCRDEKDRNQLLEKCRHSGDHIAFYLGDHKLNKLVIEDRNDDPGLIAALAEGVCLGNYQFLKYQKERVEKENPLKEVGIRSRKLQVEVIKRLNIIIEAVYKCRDLINEPLSYLTAERLSADLEIMGKESGMFVEVMNKMKIESLKMGGLLAVNMGSPEPPTFTIMEWKPANAINKKPVVLVGKGIVFDTGGINIKTAEGMSTMKCDMSGAAAAACAIYAVSKANVPVHVIALIPATENRPDGNAYVPGDVITMYDGTTVEVLNTDAEGRMILADALAYARKYDPELVIDLATLTGAAAAAIGRQGIVGMNAGAAEHFAQIQARGFNVHERIVEFPLWEDYKDLIKSDVADIKNIGGKEAGAITAAKFLQHFTDYPWIHLDIAGPAFVDSRDSYRGKGATGVAVRLLFDFLTNLSSS